MSIKSHQITVGDVRVEVVRKSIKNLHMGVYPPNGRVRVAAPMRVSDDAVRLAVVGKLGWIRRQREKFAAQPRQSAREMVSGESHYYLGRRYRLRVVTGDGIPVIKLINKSKLELRVRPGTTSEHRDRILHQWYRQEIKRLIPPLIAKWEKVLGVTAADWGVKRMKTKWGTCNTEARRIWLNLELIKKPVECLEYVVVHELVHLIERSHNERFIGILNRHFPRWQQCRAKLQSEPLGHASWTY